MKENTENPPHADPAPPVAQKSPPLTAKEELSEFFKTAFMAVLLAVLIRSFLYEPFSIPSGSMKPTLDIGDYLFVSKPAYGYSRYSFPFGIVPIEGRIWEKEPSRGDIIVFKLPTNPSIDYIKRLIGLPGDKIQMKRGRLYINDKMVPREPAGYKKDSEPGQGPPRTMVQYIETLPGGVTHSIWEAGDDEPLDNTDPYIVPPGHYFMMGDNRDNSQDSRVESVVGFVPFENLVGRADIIFFSTDGSAGLFEFWKWPWAIRYGRMLMHIKPSRLAEPADPVAPPPAG